MFDLVSYVIPGSPHHIYSQDTNFFSRVLFVFKMLITSGVFIVSRMSIVPEA